MQGKLVWFLFGALTASLLWGAVLLGVNRQLMQTFLGFAGH